MIKISDLSVGDIIYEVDIKYNDIIKWKYIGNFNFANISILSFPKTPNFDYSYYSYKEAEIHLYIFLKNYWIKAEKLYIDESSKNQCKHYVHSLDEQYEYLINEYPEEFI